MTFRTQHPRKGAIPSWGTNSWICAQGSGVVKDWKHDSLAPHWKGQYTVVLTSPTAVKVVGVTPWILHMRMKRSYQAGPEDAEVLTDPCETKIILKKKKRWSSTTTASRTCWYHLETNHSFSTKRDLCYNQNWMLCIYSWFIWLYISHPRWHEKSGKCYVWW